MEPVFDADVPSSDPYRPPYTEPRPKSKLLFANCHKSRLLVFKFPTIRSTEYHTGIRSRRLFTQLSPSRCLSRSDSEINATKLPTSNCFLGSQNVRICAILAKEQLFNRKYNSNIRVYRSHQPIQPSSKPNHGLTWSTYPIRVHWSNPSPWLDNCRAHSEKRSISGKTAKITTGTAPKDNS